jgi:hypothetical protein
MLKWIPIAIDGSPGMIPRGLIPVFEKDFQTAWFWNLLWASMKQDPQGYLPAARSTLWTFAGAHRPAHWDANGALVMAAFELREIAGRKMLCFPPLIEVIGKQMKKLRQHRGREEFSSDSTTFPQEERASLSLSQSEFDFEVRARAEKRKPQRVDTSGACSKHPDSGLTVWGSCWQCYADKHSAGAGGKGGG